MEFPDLRRVVYLSKITARRTGKQCGVTDEADNVGGARCRVTRSRQCSATVPMSFSRSLRM